jgi:hypothetical protein
MTGSKIYLHDDTVMFVKETIEEIELRLLATSMPGINASAIKLTRRDGRRVVIPRENLAYAESYERDPLPRMVADINQAGAAADKEAFDRR